MSQPIWKYAGHIGDVDPIAYGGGFVYTDETGVYCPELTYFKPAPDEEWHKTEGKTPLRVYRVLLENHAQDEWWFDRLGEIVSFTGQSVEDLQRMSGSSDPCERAYVYESLIQYFGVHEFDCYPDTMTEDAAYEKYAQEMKMARQ